MIKQDQIKPLVDRMRPTKLEEFFGQEEIVGAKAFLTGAIKNDNVPSLIFWGPPGTGKTTLATIIANETKSDFNQLSGVTSGKKDLLAIVEKANVNQRLGQKTILFIDEIHRWNKAQQDALLPHVEQGLVTLIGATTENPSFEVISALLSRARVFVLKSLTEKDLILIIKGALSNKDRGFGTSKKKYSDEVMEFIAHVANGDARTALNVLEASFKQNQKITIDLIKQIVQKSHLMYDKNGEEHYNIISALHKSMRGGDADASVYWLARMLEGGEDPKYVARRLLRFAAEDVGLADNFATVLANSVFESVHKIGMPECNVHLTQLVIYLAKTKKSIAAYRAYSLAKKDVETFGNQPVPLHIRNAPTKLMKELDYGKGYKYTPTEDSSEQEYFPEKLKNRKYIN